MTAADGFTVPDATLPEAEQKRLDALTDVLLPHLAGWDCPLDQPLDAAFRDLAETLARAAIAHVDCADRPCRSDELAVAWTRGWLFSYGQERGYTDEDAHALDVPEHLTDDLPGWCPYDPAEPPSDPFEAPTPRSPMRPPRAQAVTITFPPGRGDDGAMLMAVHRRRAARERGERA